MKQEKLFFLNFAYQIWKMQIFRTGGPGNIAKLCPKQFAGNPTSGKYFNGKFNRISTIGYKI